MQTKRIQKLSPLLINQIAAGEVVTRPASVVKELLENAIDAKASHIRIDVEQGGLGLIKVSDNGCGIHPDDMMLAVTRHATSKLANVAELTGIDSLGFRGEALASIAGVAHLTIISSYDDTGVGRQLTLSGDDASHAQIIPIVKDKGTTVSVRDLYFNVPARRNHLKSIGTEFSHIEQIVQKIAISFPNIQLELYHQSKLRLKLESNIDQLLQRLENSLSRDLQATAKDFHLSLNGLLNQEEKGEFEPKITGFLWLNQPNPVKFIYINKRLVTDFTISQVLQKVARKLGVEQLGYVLFFELPTDWINVNIHPSKQQVKIQPLTNILAWLEQAVFDNLKDSVLNISNEFSTKIPQSVQTQLATKSKNKLQVSELQQPYQVATVHHNNKESIEKTDNVAELPRVLSILDKQGYILVLHWQSHLFLLNLSKQSLLNKLILQAEEPTKTVNNWIVQQFCQQGKILQSQIEDWLQSAKKIDYADLI